MNPLAAEFLAYLAAEATPWSSAKAEAFRQILFTFADEGGLPDEVGLRQLERGQFDGRLGPAWKPVFLEAYRQWLGFLLDHRSRPRRRPLSRGWWTAPLPGVPAALPDAMAALFSPLVLSLVVVGTTALLLAPRAVEYRVSAANVAAATNRAGAALNGTLAAEEQALAHLHVRSAADLDGWAGRRLQLAGLETQLLRDIDLLAGSVRLATAASGITPQSPP